MNAQNWHFSVIQQQNLIETVNGWILEEVKRLNDLRLNEIAARSQWKFFEERSDCGHSIC